MNIRQRKIFDDWHAAEQRMAGHRPAKTFDAETARAYLLGILAVALAVVAGWMLWQMTTPAGIEQMAEIAGYIKSLIAGE